MSHHPSSSIVEIKEITSGGIAERRWAVDVNFERAGYLLRYETTWGFHHNARGYVSANWEGAGSFHFKMASDDPRKAIKEALGRLYLRLNDRLREVETRIEQIIQASKADVRGDR